MVRNYKRKTVAYDPEDMKKAVNLVSEGTMGYKKAAKLYNLKWETVRDHVKNKYKKMGEQIDQILASAFFPPQIQTKG